MTINEIYTMYSKDLYRFIFTIARCEKEFADDIFQTVMENAYKNLGKLKDREKAKSWLFSIAKQEARRYFHKKKNKVKLETVSIEENGEYEDQTTENDFADALVESDAIVNLLNRLDKNQQQIMILRYYYGMQLSEIASTISMNPATLRSIHKRSLAKLKLIIEAEGVYHV